MRTLLYHYGIDWAAVSAATGAQLHSTWANDGLLMQVAAQIERAKPEWFGMTPPLHISNL